MERVLLGVVMMVAVGCGGRTDLPEADAGPCCAATAPTMTWPLFVDPECTHPLVLAEADSPPHAGDRVCDGDGGAWQIDRVDSIADSKVPATWYQLGFYGECRQHFEVANFVIPPQDWYPLIRGDAEACN